MFAWILKVKPEKASSSGETIRPVVSRGPGWRGKFNKGVEHFPDPEVVHSAAKEDGCLAGLEVFLVLKTGWPPLQEAQYLPAGYLPGGQAGRQVQDH